jgi:hypothetical protein
LWAFAVHLVKDLADHVEGRRLVGAAASSRSCDPLVRPNWKLFNPALLRSAPPVLTIAHFEWCMVADQKFIHVGGCAANKRLLESID